MDKKRLTSRQSEILNVIRNHGGSIRTSQAQTCGISPKTLYKLQEMGTLEVIGRGVFRLAGLRDEEYEDLVRVASRLTKGIFCLETALYYHGLLRNRPKVIHVAVSPTTRTPLIEGLDVVVHRFTGKALMTGVKKQRIGGVTVRFYSVEKTLVDCFRFRSRVGVDTCVRALRRYCEKPEADVVKVREFAKACGIESVMKPYLDALSF